MKMTARLYIMPLLAVVAGGWLRVSASQAQDENREAPKQVLFTNVNIFDGVNDRLTPGTVLVEGNLTSRCLVTKLVPQQPPNSSSYS